MDGRSRAAGSRQAQAASGELRAERDGSGSGGGDVAYEARGYKQGWADERAGRRASRRPKSSKNRAAWFWLVYFMNYQCSKYYFKCINLLSKQWKLTADTVNWSLLSNGKVQIKASKLLYP